MARSEQPRPSRRFEPAPFFVLRTPLLSLDEWLSWTGAAAHLPLEAARPVLWDHLRAVLMRPEVRRALALAAPRVEAAFAALCDAGAMPDGKMMRTLVRYFARMSGRPTPFGLFAGCSVGRTGGTTSLALGTLAESRMFTTLDVGFLFGVTEAARRGPRSLDEVTVVRNPTLYRVGEHWRYVETRVDPVDLIRSYHVEAVEASETLDLILALAEEPMILAKLAERVQARMPEVERDEAVGFLATLHAAQLLVDDLEPAVTGPEPLARTVALLQGLDTPEARCWCDRLSRTAAMLRADGRDALGVSCSRDADLPAAQAPAPAGTDPMRLVQADLFKPAPEARLGPQALALLFEGAALLHRTMPSSEPATLVKFRAAFRERFGDRDIPLMEALDPDVGIPFDNIERIDVDLSPWLDGLPPPREPVPATWAARDAHLLRRIMEVVEARAHVLELTDADVEALSQGSRQGLPPCFAISAALGATSGEALRRDDIEVFIAGIVGPSGAELLGRFCHGDSDLQQAVAAWLDGEQAMFPDALLAEVAHLPQGRSGNILCRPTMRKHDILCLGTSGVDPADRIPLSDLSLRLVGNRLLLRSRRRGRDVLPRFTTAHLALTSDVVHYRFLWALHQQDAIGLAWHWGPLADAPFLPRIARGRIVLSRAAWRLTPDDAAMAAASAQDLIAFTADLRRARRLPRHVLLSEGDMALPLDLDNLACAEILQAEMRRAPVRLVEQYPAPDCVRAASAEGRFVHEVVVPVRRLDASPRPVRYGRNTWFSSTEARHAYWPGEEWLGIALFGSDPVLDRLLVTTIGPEVRAMQEGGLVQGWFFIRYWEPSAHLRVRLRGDPARLLAEVWPALLDVLRPIAGAGRLHAMRLEPYRPEVARYGGARAIAEAERVFEADSQLAIGLMRLDDPDLPDARERMALVAAHDLLQAFGLDLAEREAFARQAAEDLRAFMGFDADVAIPLGARYREQRRQLARLLEPAEIGQAASQIIAARRTSVLVYRQLCDALAHAGALAVPRAEILASLIHMGVNRLIPSRPRAVELVIYDLLRRLYAAERTRGPGA